jgi:hypothetical protein
MFYENDRLIANHDFHHFNINGIAIKASIGVSRSTSLTTAAICMQDKQLLKVTFQSLRCGQNFAGFSILLIKFI